jgi:hypothetical protein
VRQLFAGGADTVNNGLLAACFFDGAPAQRANEFAVSFFPGASGAGATLGLVLMRHRQGIACALPCSREKVRLFYAQSGTFKFKPGIVA